MKNQISKQYIQNELKIAGLSLEKFDFPKKAEKLGEMWGIYEIKYRKEILTILPVVSYRFWFYKHDKDYDYLVGSAVAEFDNNDRRSFSQSPYSRAIKILF